MQDSCVGSQLHSARCSLHPLVGETFHYETHLGTTGGVSGAGFVELKLGEGVNAVPEPGTYALLGLAGLVLCLRRRRT